MPDFRAEQYYDYLKVKENLYNRSKLNERFHNIIDMVLEEDNLRMSYRDVKSNKGSKTKGSDKFTIKDVKSVTLEDYLLWMKKWILEYNPKPVRRKYIPKSNGDKRPLGIPSIRDRLIQQAILQKIEPILEAKMNKHSFGFRHGKSTKDAIECCRNLVRHGYYIAVEFDIKKCFDIIPHNHLIDILWKNGICDKRLLMIIKKMLKAPIKEDGKLFKCEIGTPQGGIISPILTNIYLNELDKWVSSQYDEYKGLGKKESHWYRKFKKTKLKRGILVRYADDFVIFTNNEKHAQAWYYATKKWIKNNLKLDISEEKTGIVDLRKQHLTFLGYKIRGNKLGVSACYKHSKSLNSKKFRYTTSSLSDKLVEKMVKTIRLLLRLILITSDYNKKMGLVCRLNSVILGYHNYANGATECSVVFWNIYKRLKSVWYKTKYVKADATTKVTNTFAILYPECIKFEPVFSIGGITIFPIWKVNYKKLPFQDRNYLDKPNERLEHSIMHQIHLLLRRPVPERSMEYNDLRISKYSAQKGKDYVTGFFLTAEQVHCHHIIPRKLKGQDKFNNLVILSVETHRLLHSANPVIPDFYTQKMKDKFNVLREKLKKENKTN